MTFPFPRLQHPIRALVWLLAGILGAAAVQGAEDKPTVPPTDGGLNRWTENFSDLATFPERWVPYGRLADGQWAQGPKARPEWWQIVDGALRGQNFPDEKHGAGITHRLAGADLRLRCRIKVAAESIGTIRFFGKSAGVLPAEKTDNHVTALEVSAAGLKIWNGNRLRDEGEAARFHNTYFEKVEKLAITPDVWHTLAIEIRGQEIKARLDDQPEVVFALKQEQPMSSLSLEANGNKKEIGVVWFDDFALEPL